MVQIFGDRILQTNSSFGFDGTHSDIARQLYIRHQAGDWLDVVKLSFIPTAVSDRLDPLNIDFDHLPGTVQRAVLWDTGFAIAPGNKPVQVWTLDGYSMANIAVPWQDVLSAGCKFKNCQQPNNINASYTTYCTGDQMVSASRCMTDSFEDPGAKDFFGAMWSNGSDIAMAPRIRLRDHVWTDPSSRIQYSVYAIHTVTAATDATWDTCPENGGYASLTVPCYQRGNVTSEVLAAMTKPTGSPWVTAWLEEEFAVKCGFGKLLLIPIILGVLFVIGVSGWLYWRWKVSMARSNRSSTVGSGLEIVSPQYWVARSPCTNISRPTESTIRPSTIVSNSPTAIRFEDAGSNSVLKILLNSDKLSGKRIAYDSLIFERALSKGASGEVWVCELQGRKVAIKRLLQSKTQSVEKVQAFAEEIKFNASLTHSHIVEFIGVAWNSLNNLVMVLEFLSVGNLKDYLDENAARMSWARHKIHNAIGIAQALKYLHSRSPALIHRDLKSNNILLTKELEPKLIDFGVRRGCVNLTMTAAVGTPYWTAPEVLEGKRYSEQADIYSFGVVLSELDTGKVPYHDIIGKGKDTLMAIQVLKGVAAGTLRPSFSEDCPSRIQRVGLACMAHNTLKRPSVEQILLDLEGRNDGVVYSL
ncbi:unnamed protein product [Phytophthora fragariaefolia]|uniref:Unnamed protein product n=1 Tax=Phytophthora fragariaefolia TaxID=1490495 RepID=A0A9W6UDF4_9STRA|nr:unnamed protein product [Phytophthora fragariaefolia]